MSGISKNRAATRRVRRPQVGGTKPEQGTERQKPLSTRWRTRFLEALAITSNVTAAAREAGAPLTRVYNARRDNPEFAAQWRAALGEGYEHLEMEVLAYLRGADSERKLDVPNAIRLLAAHRKTVAEIRAAQEPDDEEAVLASIDELIDRMRREAANTGGADERAG